MHENCTVRKKAEDKERGERESENYRGKIGIIPSIFPSESPDSRVKLKPFLWYLANVNHIK